MPEGAVRQPLLPSATNKSQPPARPPRTDNLTVKLHLSHARIQRAGQGAPLTLPKAKAASLDIIG
jgi:hypothetical protein